ncbi:hypothetical protein P152DRAFT_468795 [Eremomyces bilateralis CBS 781.70]|uniref:Biogenesis of lysosome-related organelles complex 1 subunit CNL1 n=1 Tax=Eremomyces bilateralis CBS 781.70 TaxID=1392243 RepID=A0A6G1FSR8_9PEZI|nr:uncharacterized protein P152DRAFT_468795 [Eremomyces bilateralis CBS 781.70]KAF1808770.1 hypothetical protein P152DRAFT_468795 [Eremomyces bilateralis CBS 781.70]
MSTANSVNDTQLGLSTHEVQLLRYHQTAALQQSAPQSTSSRAASAASSQGRLLLDPSSLAALSAHLDRVIHEIQRRWAALHAQTQQATQLQYDRAGNVVGDADAAIEQFQQLCDQIEELQMEFEKIKRIGEIVKGYRARVEALDRRVGR